MRNIRLRKGVTLLLLFCAILSASCQYTQAQTQGEITNASVQVSLFTKEVAAAKLTFLVYDVDECPFVLVGYKVNNSLVGYTYPGFWEKVENGWLFTYEDVIPFTNVTGEFPNDRYKFQLYLLTNLTTAFERVINRDIVFLISPNYVSTAYGQEIMAKDDIVNFALHTQNLTHAFQIDGSIYHPKGFGEAVAPFVSWLPIGLLLFGLFLMVLLIRDWLGYTDEGFPSTIFISCAVSVIIFLPMYWFSIRQFQNPLSYTPFDKTLFRLTLFYLILLSVAIWIRLCGRKLRDFTKNFAISLQEEESQPPKRVTIPKRVAERLDRAFDLITLLIGIISATILQYATALGDVSFTTFAMRIVFIPIIPIILFWLGNQLTNNPDLKVFIRIFVWFFGVFTLFNDIFFFLLLSFLKQLATSIPLAFITLIILYFFAFLLNRRIETMYGYGGRNVIRIYIAAKLLAIILSITTIILASLP